MPGMEAMIAADMPESGGRDVLAGVWNGGGRRVFIRGSRGKRRVDDGPWPKRAEHMPRYPQ